MFAYVTLMQNKENKCSSRAKQKVRRVMVWAKGIKANSRDEQMKDSGVFDNPHWALGSNKKRTKTLWKKKSLSDHF